MLAEVSDKLPSPAFFWCLHLAAAGLVLALALFSHRRAVLLVLLPLTLAWAVFFVHNALVADDPLREDVGQETGVGSVAHEAPAALLPAAVVLCGLIIGRRAPSVRGFDVRVRLDRAREMRHE
jgi:hypothetical protein